MILEELRGVPASEIPSYLEGICESVESTRYLRPLSEEEIETARLTLEQDMLVLQNMEEEFAEIKKEHAERIKTKKAEVVFTLRQLKHKSSEESGNVYTVADHENGRMLYVTSQGNVINSRPLMSSERNGNLFHMKKAE